MSRSEKRPRQVGILLFDDVEVLDFAGPFEVFPSHPSGSERTGCGCSRWRHRIA